MDYVLEASAFERISLYGLVGAVLTLSAWFAYLQQIAGGESKRFWQSATVLAAGMGLTCMAVPLHDISEFALGLGPDGSYLNDLVYKVVSGLIEEALKIVPVLLIMRLTDLIQRPVDYIVYGSISALGFAFMENLLPGTQWRPGTISTRASGAVIAHITYTSLIMYGLFYAKYRVNKSSAPYFFIALGAACMLHGLSNFTVAREWAVLSFIILIYLIRQYGMIINTTLSASALGPNWPKRQVELTEYLCFSLGLLLMLQYVVNALSFGPSNANSAFWRASVSYFWIFAILVNLDGFDIRKRRWLPLLRTSNRRRMTIRTGNHLGNTNRK